VYIGFGIRTYDSQIARGSKPRGDKARLSTNSTKNVSAAYAVSNQYVHSTKITITHQDHRSVAHRAFACLLASQQRPSFRADFTCHILSYFSRPVLIDVHAHRPCRVITMRPAVPRLASPPFPPSTAHKLAEFWILTAARREDATSTGVSAE